MLLDNILSLVFIYHYSLTMIADTAFADNWGQSSMVGVIQGGQKAFPRAKRLRVKLECYLNLEYVQCIC